MNKYNLLPLNDRSFACDVFWEQSSIANVLQSPEAMDLEGTQTVAALQPDEIKATTVPLHLIQCMSTHFPASVWTLDFLHAQVKAAVPNMPDQGQDWGRCKPLSTSFLAGGRMAGWFVVPRGHDKFSGVSFKKELIFEVLNIKSSSTSEINKLFAPEGLEKAPKSDDHWLQKSISKKIIARCNPAPTNGSQPDSILVEEDANEAKHQTHVFNTETAEQLDSWLNGFESQLHQMLDVNYDFFIPVLMMIYAERVKKQVDTKDLGLSDEFWAEATG
ncbi:hypothetical protein DFH08DRAFT_967830 [Mycena albidolilacea]|uniref:Uncharacterized protein n=1 Tax=Mycena albidolilacea TaxID=1033008 RepID=A0AAD6ZLK2_9AGAR|nr:hypothetical protein DFH08DRAFT_967830 [Mycena albidolilacea]